MSSPPTEPWLLENGSIKQLTRTTNCHGRTAHNMSSSSLRKKSEMTLISKLPSSLLKVLLSNIQEVIFGTKLSFLFIAVPVAVAAHHFRMSQPWIFSMSLVGLIPLAERVSFLTEQIAFYTGATVGGLLNATCGNATELIIGIFALLQHKIDVVKYSLLGSILSNLLLVLGSALLCGGLANISTYQTFDRKQSDVNISLLLLALLCNVMPLLYKYGAANDQNPAADVSNADTATLYLSRACSIVMLLAYFAYLAFQLWTHNDIFESQEEEEEDDLDTRQDESPVIGLWGGIIWLTGMTALIALLGAEELFREDRNDEENKKRLLSMDIDEILERAEKIEQKGTEGEAGNELLSAFKVANFCSAEDDGTFWSRWIKPEAITQADEALAPRAARNSKSYAEVIPPERNNKRKKKGVELQERGIKRRKADYSSYQTPALEGASAQTRDWSYGTLPKRDATRFFRAVKKFGNDSQISLIATEVGGCVEAAPVEAQVELFDALLDGCREAVNGGSLDAKGPLLDFFGVPVKADDLLNRVEELQLLGKRINRYKDPISQFQALMYLKPATWSKGCGWNQKDDARLLLGIHYHGFGNWEKIRLDEKLGLFKKIAPVELQHHETFLPRAPQLKERASQLLEMELAAVGGKSFGNKGGRKGSKKQQKDHPPNNLTFRGKGKQLKPGGSPVTNGKSKMTRGKKNETLAKEEGEMSDTEEVYEQFREVKWMEWCEDVLIQEKKTLERLHRLQTTSADLPKEKVLSRIRNYLQILGRKIDQIVIDHEKDPYKQERMTTRLWNYVSTFSNLSGGKLQQIYTKLKQENQVAGVGTSQINQRDSRNQSSALLNNNKGGLDTAQFEAWKRRRRAESDPNTTAHLQRPSFNSPDPSLGILGPAPSLNNRPINERTRLSAFGPKQGFT